MPRWGTNAVHPRDTGGPLISAIRAALTPGGSAAVKFGAMHSGLKVSLLAGVSSVTSWRVCPRSLLRPSFFFDPFAVCPRRIVARTPRFVVLQFSFSYFETDNTMAVMSLYQYNYTITFSFISISQTVITSCL